VFTSRQSRLSAVAAAFFAISAGAQADTLLPTFMSVDVPEGTRGAVAAQTNIVLNPLDPLAFTDDVYLNTLRFGSTTFSGANAFAVADRLEVLSNRGQVNVEWGDDDGRGTADNPAADPEDGDFNPMAKIGQPDSNKEITDPSIQDAGLLSVFNTLSLTEMSDGEGGAAHSFKVLFDRGITDNDAGEDDTPEIVMFERGLNDTFSISLIVGGTFEDPELSAALEISSSSFARMGIRTDTTEIGGPQDIGVGGFDLNDWAIAEGQSIFGFVFNGVGADLSGIFLSQSDGNFTPPLAPIPLPAGAWLMLAGLGALVWQRRRPA